MNRSLLLLVPVAGALVLLLAGGCATTSQNAMVWESRLGPIDASPMSRQSMFKDLNVKQMLIPKGKYGRRSPVAMTPRFITIHSTENPTGDAYAHAKALNRGALRGGRRTGYLFWHFTVQDNTVIQHIPINEAGEHADIDGPGNHTSIGIEMAEHRGNDLARTIDRTARLTAVLMRQYDIPLSNVVPHYHWPREGYNPAHKNCPHFLLERGKPGQTWQWFKSRVQKHYARIELSETMAKGAGGFGSVFAHHDVPEVADLFGDPAAM